VFLHKYHIIRKYHKRCQNWDFSCPDHILVGIWNFQAINWSGEFQQDWDGWTVWAVSLGFKTQIFVIVLLSANAFFPQTCKHHCVCQPSSLPDICPDDTDSKTNGLLPQNTHPWWNPVTYTKAAWQKTKRRGKTTQTKNKIYKCWISTHWKVRKA